MPIAIIRDAVRRNLHLLGWERLKLLRLAQTRSTSEATFLVSL
jgi:hypothetical protein